MKAFISYSHNDQHWLDRFHTHLSHIKREGKLTSWTDQQIPSGGQITKIISKELDSSQLFFALLSPDYLASSYCYEQEFQRALELHEKGKIVIIPIILEACDWLNTPFQNYKALPKDGKAISTWENSNNAFLDVINNIRLLITNDIDETRGGVANGDPSISLPRNYRVKKDFDSIQKLEFLETTFSELKDTLSRYLAELSRIDSNLKSRSLTITESTFEYILVNRNKIGTEAELIVSIDSNSTRYSYANEKTITYKVTQGYSVSESSFKLAFDEYHMFWVESRYSFSIGKEEWTTKDITDKIWNDWLESVGII